MMVRMKSLLFQILLISSQRMLSTSSQIGMLGYYHDANNDADSSTVVKDGIREEKTEETQNEILGWKYRTKLDNLIQKPGFFSKHSSFHDVHASSNNQHHSYATIKTDQTKRYIDLDEQDRGNGAETGSDGGTKEVTETVHNVFSHPLQVTAPPLGALFDESETANIDDLPQNTPAMVPAHSGAPTNPQDDQNKKTFPSLPVIPQPLAMTSVQWKPPPKAPKPAINFWDKFDKMKDTSVDASMRSVDESLGHFDKFWKTLTEKWKKSNFISQKPAKNHFTSQNTPSNNFIPPNTPKNHMASQRIPKTHFSNSYFSNLNKPPKPFKFKPLKPLTPVYPPWSPSYHDNPKNQRTSYVKTWVRDSERGALKNNTPSAGNIKSHADNHYANAHFNSLGRVRPWRWNHKNTAQNAVNLHNKAKDATKINSVFKPPLRPSTVYTKKPTTQPKQRKKQRFQRKPRPRYNHGRYQRPAAKWRPWYQRAKVQTPLKPAEKTNYVKHLFQPAAKGPNTPSMMLKPKKRNKSVEEIRGSFCSHKKNGNYVNPGLKDDDPRCSFITCSNKRTFLFQCPDGTWHQPGDVIKIAKKKDGHSLLFCTNSGSVAYTVCGSSLDL